MRTLYKGQVWAKDTNGIIQAEKLLSLTGDWKAYLKEARETQAMNLSNMNEQDGR